MRPLRQRIVPSFLALLAAGNLAAAGQNEPATTVNIFAAGSLRAVVSELAAAGPRLHIDVKATFGGSGTLRERVERGEHPDLLLSADLGSPRMLERAGLTLIPVIAFARNRMCVVSRRELDLTQSNLIARLLLPGTRIRTSTPVADPAGDYAWAIFDRIDGMQAGAGARLKEKAGALMNVEATPAEPGRSAVAALFVTGRIDATITYCSASAALLRELPELTSLEIPATLDPHPVYGIAVLSDNPAALRLALLLLSEKGQAIIAGAGLMPLL